MSKYAVINDKNIDINYLSNNKAEYEVVSKEKGIDISRNDLFILLNNKEDKAPKFVSKGSITSISKPVPVQFTKEEQEKNKKLILANKPPLDQKYSRIVNIEIDELLKGDNYFEDYVYSLTTVNDYEKPIIHFQQKSKFITLNDYNTIIESKVYVSRTAFGKFVNALPKENKFEFSVYAMKKFNTTTFKGVNYLELFKFLLDYIEKHILSIGRLIVETDNLIKTNLLDTGIPRKEVGFLNEESDMSDNLFEQAELFRDLFNLENQIHLIKRIQHDIEENKETESDFDKLFKNRLWPLNLN